MPRRSDGVTGFVGAASGERRPLSTAALLTADLGGGRE